MAQGRMFVMPDQLVESPKSPTLTAPAPAGERAGMWLACEVKLMQVH